ncbi:MAG: hypothetical protein BKP49_07145 [Treponema sp. CETP13]|nr:MAG: hypothetical protein BKP49_07145 [Treponema sp. CETP13]
MKKPYSKNEKVVQYVELLSSNPAVTIMLSFAAVIVLGSVLFLFPFTAKDGHGLSVINALFESTSAVCVTGLIVVDTVTHFNFIGQFILLILIQTGGLGIMILSFFTLYVMRRQVSINDKIFLSTILSEEDSGQLFDALKTIIITTFVIESCGAIFLLIGLIPKLGFSLQIIWYAIFHSVSGFCNAGFALFPDSLESFTNNPVIILSIALLIILGSLGFGTITNIKAWFFSWKNRKKYKETKRVKLSLNTQIVLLGTGVLIFGGALVLYGLEYTNALKNLPTWQQYLAAFFQSITMRTAGFSSITYEHLHTGTYLFLCILMFIGAASGGTGGGIKINTLSIILAAFTSFLHGEKKVHLHKYEIDYNKVIEAFLVLTTAIAIIGVGTIILCFTEQFSLIKVLFEIVSAMGTVGVSSGITSHLSMVGRIVVIIIMFWGRIGVLTMLSVASIREDPVKFSWPRADISIG